jgi:hypothetical protein
MGSSPSFQTSKQPGVQVLDKLILLSRIRLGRGAAIAGASLLGVLALSLLVFLIAGNGRVKRVLFFPLDGSGRLVAEERFLTNRHELEGDMRELVEEEILGPVRHDAGLLMPRDVTVRSIFVRSRVVYLDLSADFLRAGPEYPVHGREALSALEKAIGFNFPGVREVFITIGGQSPRFGDEKKIR